MSGADLLDEGTSLVRRSATGITGGVLVAVGAVVSGMSAYLFLALTARYLGPGRDAALSALWSLAFLAGPGFFLPVEQELSRLGSARARRGVGSRQLIASSALIGSAAAAILIIATLAFAGPATSRLFDGQPLLLIGFVLTLPGYLCMHLTWGVLAGRQRLGGYAVVTATEGMARLVIGLALLAGGVRSAGPFGLALGIAPFVAAGAGYLLRGDPDTDAPDDCISAPALSRALLALLGGSLLNQFLLMAGPIAVKLLGKSHDPAVGRFLAGMVLVRVPLFLFNAVLAALLPRLSALVAVRELREFRLVLRGVIAAVVAAGGVLVIAAATIAPPALVALFGDGYRLGPHDLAILAAGCATYMLALTFSQGLIARSGHLHTTAAWAVGVSSFVLVIVCCGRLGLLGRVEWGFLTGCAAAAATMGALLAQALRLDKRAEMDRRPIAAA